MEFVDKVNESQKSQQHIGISVTTSKRLQSHSIIIAFSRHHTASASTYLVITG